MLARNVGTVDRILRVMIGVALLVWAITGMPAHAYSWIGYIGVIPLITAFMGSCPLYALIGVKTCRTA